MLFGGNLKKPSRQLLVSNAWFTILYVICAMQIMSATQPDTFSNVLHAAYQINIYSISQD